VTSRPSADDLRVAESDAYGWTRHRYDSRDASPVSNGWEAEPVWVRGARLSWIRSFRWQAACDIADWAISGTRDDGPMPDRVADAVRVYQATGADLADLADWVIAQPVR
jgi:hypothetical protein